MADSRPRLLLVVSNRRKINLVDLAVRMMVVEMIVAVLLWGCFHFFRR